LNNDGNFTDANEAPYFSDSTPAGAAAQTFRPPYNKLSRFRDPGRVNINTVFDLRVWEAIAKNFPQMDPGADPRSVGDPQNFLNFDLLGRLFFSRRGCLPPSGGNWLTLDPDYPTLFGNPFRSAASADLMPNVAPAGKPPLRKDGVQATLLRQDLLYDTSVTRNDPLFVPDATSCPEVSAQYRNQDRNALFRYQGLMRLSNILTTHSNVFAVWITVGYFELERNPGGVDAGHPDGYRLGQEIGADTGEVRRHRAFYIIDRSIPVAFQPGENHNVDRCILVRRFIE
jgi:hypothetical protein